MATGRVVTTGLQPFGEGTFTGGIFNKNGFQVIVDFYLYMALTGGAFQVRAGTITTPLVGDVVITDTAAEMGTAAASGLTIIPVALGIGVRLATGTLQEYAAKSVASATLTNGAFTALPLRLLGPGNATTAAALTSSAVAAAGGVTVAAELATTTRRHWEFSNPIADAAGSDVGIAATTAVAWNPRVPPILPGPSCFYVQIAATGTGPSYYAHYDFIEASSSALLG